MAILSTDQKLSFLENNVRVRAKSDSEFTISIIVTGPLGAYQFHFTESGKRLVSCFRTNAYGGRFQFKESEPELWRRFAYQISLVERDFGRSAVSERLPKWLKNLKQPISNTQ